VFLADFPRQVDEHMYPASSGRRETDVAHTRVALAETRAQVRSCIQHLPEPYRQVLLLRDIEELDIAQTAQRLGASRDAVKSRLHRARQALRACLEPLLRTPA
jgi:RNA polymerase sigma-70 factor (ECF subfamily)